MLYEVITGMKLAGSFGLEISFETHRSRSLFNPWVTQRIVKALPAISLTADIRITSYNVCYTKLLRNFSYHNVHHDQQIQPWYRLPKLHRVLYGTDTTQVLMFSDLVRSYHRYRVARVLNGDPADLDVKHDDGRTFVGVDGVSFLV